MTDSGYEAISASYEAGGTGCKPRILNRLATRKRERETYRCQEAEEQHREATDALIEARRQADAADAGAILSFKETGITAWGAGLGFVTMMAAIGAALFAERAAHHTKRSANIASTANRPWIAIGLRLRDGLVSQRGGISGGFTLSYENLGQSPALNIGIRALLRDGTAPRVDVAQKAAGVSGQTLFPGDEREIEVSALLPSEDNVDRPNQAAWHRNLIVTIEVDYRFSDGVGRTYREYWLRGPHTLESIDSRRLPINLMHLRLEPIPSADAAD
jgi:hypothetical protein